MIARLDSALLEAEITVIQAEREDLLARQKLVANELKRQQDLIRQGFASEQRIDELSTQQSSLVAQLKKQQALYLSAQTRLKKHSIIAPYGGEVASRQADVGSVAVPGQVVVQLLEEGGAEAKVGVPLRLMSDIKFGDVISVEINGEQVDASVLATSSRVDPITHTATLRLLLPSDELFVDGELLYALLPEQLNEPGYWVADTALSASVRGLWNVLVLVPEPGSELFRIEARSVDVLHLSAGEAYVRGALQPQERYIESGVHRIAPGLLVRVEAEPITLAKEG